MDVEAVTAEEVDGQIPLHEDGELNVVGEQLKTELLVEVVLASVIGVLREPLDGLAERADTHPGIEQLGLERNVLIEIPTSEDAPLPHTRLDVVRVTVISSEVDTTFEAPMELSLRRRAHREEADERQRCQQFFHYFFLRIYKPDSRKALRAATGCFDAIA